MRQCGASAAAHRGGLGGRPPSRKGRLGRCMPAPGAFPFLSPGAVSGARPRLGGAGRPLAVAFGLHPRPSQEPRSPWPRPAPHRLGDPRRGRRRPARTSARRRRAGDRAPRASRPSGPVHLGNLREFLTVALRRRRAAPPRRAGAAPARVGRLRPVPQGAGRRRPVVRRAHRPAAGRACPTRGAATPPGPSTSRSRCSTRSHAMGVEMEEISQTERYRAGVYRDAGAARRPPPATTSRRCSRGTAPRRSTPSRGRARAGGRGAGRLGRRRRRGPRRRRAAWPGSRSSPTAATAAATRPRSRRTTTRPPTSPTPAPSCDYAGTTNLATQDEGKLVWKVDWPMRWAFEHVDFEPAGMDHATPGSSFTVGHELVETVFGMPAAGVVRLRLRRLRRRAEDVVVGAAARPPPQDALRVLEAPILRWLYVRRQPKQTFDIDFGPEVVRLYDEWDALGRKAADPDKRDAQVLAFERASATATAGPAAGARGRRTVPAAVVGRRRDRRLGRADQPDRLARRARRTTRSTTSSRGCRGRWPGPREFVPESDRTTVRERARHARGWRR